VAILAGLGSYQAAQLDAPDHNDALTGVPNRRAWDLELARHLANARRSGEPVVVALLDLDHFKRFNDQYGQFGVCVTGLAPAAVAQVLDRVQAATPLGQTFSAGVAAWTGEEAPERLVARADEALHRATRAGRGRVMVHDGQTVAAPAQGLVATAETG